ncbi:MAG: hypothetical protein SFU84_05285 [Gemmatimonadales bacterium]|nr:hypothetical protein [Gemmatimonadales bacterium]
MVLIFNATAALGRVGGYPFAATPDKPPFADDPNHVLAQDPDVATLAEMAKAQTDEAMWHLTVEPSIGFGAYHFSCNPYRDLDPYQLPGGMSAEEYMAWVSHLFEKTWMGRSDFERMIDFFWRHKGAQPPSLK